MKNTGLLHEVLENLQVWQKATPIPGYNEDEWRLDAYGNPIRFEAYGDRRSKFGWEHDHIIPLADGGPDTLSNLRPLQWEANVRRKSSRGIIGDCPPAHRTLGRDGGGIIGRYAHLRSSRLGLAAGLGLIPASTGLLALGRAGSSRNE